VAAAGREEAEAPRVPREASAPRRDPDGGPETQREPVSVDVVIAAGGTAGHVYPGLALAEAIRGRSPGTRIAFIGTPRGIEREEVPAAGYELHLIDVVPWARTLGARRYLAPFSLAAASMKTRSLLGRLRPRSVVGMGGYASLPVVLAASTRRIPTLLHEQNAVPGIANVVGVRVARRIGLAFEEARSALPLHAEVRVLGNPIRRSIATLDRGALRAEALRAFGLDAGRTTVLVMGGSLGAARLNEAVAGLADRWRDRSDAQLLVAAGRKHGEALRERTRDAGDALRVVDYLDRVELAYAAADVAVCRAGAATVAELAAVGLPSILVPYPHARANHQEANARALERAGGAIVILDAAVTPEALGVTIDGLLADPEALERLSKGARSFGRPNAADDLGAWALELAGGSDG
jgi:UDP-N-acetylglucosamine--N-acetylmuramyl-(pentapeptide) pyrophosphoryl-undecaprenol N-acetylglucosamine transferase